jgi:hypothetical protein
LSNNNGYDKIKVANGIQQRSCEKSILSQKILFFPILGGRAPCAPSLDPHLLDHFTKLPKHTYTRPEEADVTSLLEKSNLSLFYF